MTPDPTPTTTPATPAPPTPTTTPATPAPPTPTTTPATEVSRPEDLIKLLSKKKLELWQGADHLEELGYTVEHGLNEVIVQLEDGKKVELELTYSDGPQWRVKPPLKPKPQLKPMG
jgi:hypothetical protein